MSALAVRDAYHDLVLPVAAFERPPLGVSWLSARDAVFAVFAEDSAADVRGEFLGLVTWGRLAQHPQRVFADLVPRPAPDPLGPESPLEEAVARLELEDRPALAVLDDGEFSGAVTHASVMEALLTEEGRPWPGATRLGRTLRRLQELEARSLRVDEIAHDLSNALQAVAGRAGLLERSPSVEGRGQAQAISRATARAAELLARLRATTPGAHRAARFSLAQRLPGFERYARLLLPEEVEVGLELTCPGWVSADLTDLERVLANLVVNAREAMPRGGQLRIVLDEVEVDGAPAGEPEEVAPGRYVRLSVRDTGHGMDLATRARIFEPRFSTRGEDRGLGLGNVLKLLRRNDACLRCSSTPGQGASFEVLLRPAPPEGEPE